MKFNFEKQELKGDPLKGDKFIVDEQERIKRERNSDIESKYSNEIYQKDDDIYEESKKKDPKGDKEGRPMKPFVPKEDIVDPDTEEGSDDIEEDEDEDIEEDGEKFSKREMLQKAKIDQDLKKKGIGYYREDGVASVGPDIKKKLAKNNQVNSQIQGKKILIKKKKLIKKNQFNSNFS
jgi:hypothetical protein